jgi:hypothetical protein
VERAPRPAKIESSPVFRKYVILFLPLLLIVLGLGMAVASLASDIQTDYANNFSGMLVPGNATLALPSTPAEFVLINMTVMGCNLRLYPATTTEWLLFNATGALPPTWIDCTNHTKTVTGETKYLVLVNGGSSPQSYEVTISAYSILAPYGWLALPGTVLALAGLVLFVPRIITGEALRMRDEVERRKEK